MSTLTVVIYGIIQGLSEFLPISSSGHLALLPHFLEFKDPGVFFDLVMHFGTALAVIIYFRKDLVLLIRNSAPLFYGEFRAQHSFFSQNFIIATFSSVVFILVLKGFALDYGRSNILIGINLIVFGILMGIADRCEAKGVNLFAKRDIKRSVIIGLAQALAIFPGVSRSGITLTAARFGHVSREDAGRFSFLLSLPIILASIAYKSKAILKGEAVSESWLTMGIGVSVSFIVGLITIHYFLKLINRFGLVYYSVYRVILGFIVIYFTVR